MKQFSRWLTMFACLLAGLPLSTAYALDAVTLQLKWTHAFQFAGYYAAKEQGYYRDAGLDVRIDEALPGTDPVKIVLEGKAEYGVGTSALLLERNAGKPVVALAVIFQHSPYVLIARQQNAAQTIHDLVGKRVMLEPQADEILAYLKQEGIALNRITQLAHSYDPQDLIDGKADAIAAYLTNQPYYLDRAHFAYQIHTPRSAGIDFYGDNLFTTEQELRAHPERVKEFRAASLRGWRYAMENPDRIIDLILAKYSQRHTRDYYLFEVKQMIPLLRPELIDIGYMYPGRWRHMADTYADIGVLPREFSLDGFLYDPNPKLDLTWFYRSLVAAVLLTGIVSGVALYIARNNRRLVRVLGERKRTEDALRESEARFITLTSTIEEVFWIADSEIQQMFYISPGYERIWGRSQQSLYDNPKSFVESIHPQDRERVLADLEVEKTGQPFDHEYRIIRPDGCIRRIWDRGFPVKSETGRVGRYAGVALDITDRKRTEDALRESEARFRSLTELSSDWYWEQDEDFRFTRMSSPRGIGREIPEDELLGKTRWELGMTHESEDGMAVHRSTLAAHLPFRDFEYSVDVKGRRVYLSVSGLPMFDDKGRFIGYRGVGRNITERKLAESMLIQSTADLKAAYRQLAETEEQERRTLARELHDQVSQNLSVLNLNLNRMNSEFGNLPSEGRKRVSDSLALVEETAQQIRDIMSFLRPPMLDDYGLFATLRWWLHESAMRSGIAIELTGAEAEPRLPNNLELMLFRVAQEALLNAIKHSGAKHIVVLLETLPGSVRLGISDDGRGMVRDVGQEARVRPTWGILNMRERAEAIGGSLRVESGAGTGTRIVVEVPRDQR